MACPLGYKSLLVVVDGAPQTRRRVDAAATIAARFDAHLVGLYLTLNSGTPGKRRAAATIFDPLYRECEQKAHAAAAAVRGLFEDITHRQDVSAEWRAAWGDPSELASLHGRYADLVVIGQIDPDEIEALPLRPLPEEVALRVGRPILVVPYAGAFDEIGRRILVGWDASREATRAVNDAMPLLAGADTVRILAVDPEDAANGHSEIPGADIALHLARHGVNATIEHTISAGIGVGNVLLSRASDIDADLLVIGAYGHSRFRELLLGGATRTVLQSMTLPVLMSH